jgi:hypothetical protein
MRKLAVLLFAAVFTAAAVCSASPFTAKVSFNEDPFPRATNSTFSYNLLDDSSGSLLSADNGDLIDFTIVTTQANGNVSVEWQTIIGKSSALRRAASQPFMPAPPV